MQPSGGSMPVKKLCLVAAGVIMGYLTLWGIAALGHLPYSRLRDSLTDYLSLPGGVLAFLFYPAGVHTGRGAPAWGWIAYIGNLIFYSILWIGVMSMVSKLIRSARK
jgi:hypothetical protein